MQAQLVINSGSSRCNPTFKWVAECLYRHSKSGAYYALVKRNGKQFRKSLKTSDRQLAERSLISFRLNVGRIANPVEPGWSSWVRMGRAKIAENEIAD
ncbi:MAG: hypothetical protein ABSG80_07610 [Verrucomicrobiota bacterium]|jgi:hypothetical protein